MTDPFLFTTDSYLLRSRKPFSRTHSGTVVFCNTSLTATPSLTLRTRSFSHKGIHQVVKKEGPTKKQTLSLPLRHGYQARIFFFERGDNVNHLRHTSQTTQPSCFNISFQQFFSFVFFLFNVKSQRKIGKQGGIFCPRLSLLFSLYIVLYSSPPPNHFI